MNRYLVRRIDSAPHPATCPLVATGGTSVRSNDRPTYWQTDDLQAFISSHGYFFLVNFSSLLKDFDNFHQNAPHRTHKTATYCLADRTYLTTRQPSRPCPPIRAFWCSRCCRDWMETSWWRRYGSEEEGRLCREGGGCFGVYKWIAKILQ